MPIKYNWTFIYFFLFFEQGVRLIDKSVTQSTFTDFIAQYFLIHTAS